MITVTGYRDGKPVGLVVTYIDTHGHLLEVGAARDFARMAAECKRATGEDIVINDAFRDYATQRRKYDVWTANLEAWMRKGKQGDRPLRPSKPGHSAHGYGKAIDIDRLDDAGKPRAYTQWIDEHHEEYGFRRTVMPAEPWHFEHIGGTT